MEQWLQPVWLLTLLHLGRRRLRTSAADGSRSANLYLLPLGVDANESCCGSLCTPVAHRPLPLAHVGASAPGSAPYAPPSGVFVAVLHRKTMMLNFLLSTDPTVSGHFAVYDNFRQRPCRSHSNFHKKDLLFHQLWYYHKTTKLEVLVYIILHYRQIITVMILSEVLLTNKNNNIMTLFELKQSAYSVIVPSLM